MSNCVYHPGRDCLCPRCRGILRTQNDSKFGDGTTKGHTEIMEEWNKKREARYIK